MDSMGWWHWRRNNWGCFYWLFSWLLEWNHMYLYWLDFKWLVALKFKDRTGCQHLGKSWRDGCENSAEFSVSSQAMITSWKLIWWLWKVQHEWVDVCPIANWDFSACHVSFLFFLSPSNDGLQGVVPMDKDTKLAVLGCECEWYGNGGWFSGIDAS